MKTLEFIEEFTLFVFEVYITVFNITAAQKY